MERLFPNAPGLVLGAIVQVPPSVALLGSDSSGGKDTEPSRGKETTA